MVRLTVSVIFMICSLISSSSLAAGGFAGAPPEVWRRIDDGLLVGEFAPSVESSEGDSRITVVRVDPRKYALKLLCASEHGGQARTLREWCRAFKLVAAVNAGMYQQDGLHNVGFMKNFNHFNNKRFNSYKSVLAFNPRRAGIPPVQIIDGQCQAFAGLTSKYNTLIQNIRMVSCTGVNVWQQQGRRWSMVALGMSKKGEVLLLFTQSPYSVHEFIDTLLGLPIGLGQAMYLEGGSPASLYLSANGVELEKSGDFENGFNAKTMYGSSWSLPNVIGIVKRQ